MKTRQRIRGRHITSLFAVILTAAAAAAAPTPTAPPGIECGNGLLDSGEACDDGNHANGDGCDFGCRIEPCFSCVGEPSNCVAGPSSIVSVDTIGNVGSHTSIAIGTDGLPLISYHDTTNLDLKVAHCDDASCTTATITTVDDTGDVGKYSALAIGSDGLPFIVYQAPRTCTPNPLSPSFCIGYGLRVAHCNDFACSTPATKRTLVGRHVGWQRSAVTIGADGLPLISYQTWSGSSNMFISSTTASIIHCADVECATVDVSRALHSDTYNAVPYSEHGGTTGYAHASVLGADGNALLLFGSRRVAFPGPTGMHLARCENPSCTTSSLQLVAASGDASLGNSLVLAPSGHALISRVDYDESLYTASCGDVACSHATVNTVENSSSVRHYSSIGIGADNLGVIAYYDQDRGDLRAAHCNDASCSSVSNFLVDDVGDVGQYLSLTVGGDGIPLISYYDATNGDLKVAHVCPVTAGCGNGTIEPGEQCDDGNSLRGDSCTNLCAIPPTPTVTRTSSPTRTRTPAATPTETAPAADTYTATPITTPTVTASATDTHTATPTTAPTVTASATDTHTATPTTTPTVTASATDTHTATPTTTPTVTASATDTHTATPTPTPTATWTEIPTLTPSITPTAVLRCAAMPQVDCRSASTTSVSVKDGTDNRQDTVVWKWRGGTATVVDDFSNPTVSSAGFAFCIYDYAGGVPALAGEALAVGASSCAGRSCWARLPRGFRYRDRGIGGSLEILLSVAANGKAALKLKAKGNRLPLAAPAGPSQLFHQNPQLRVQLLQPLGNPCWEATYPAPAIRNTAKFDARVR